ncbi:MAG: patatin-like phospholipase family protein [Rubrobacter sp.]|nr:patatin-like phospholipase family protein [Rubrobacter sp.]
MNGERETKRVAIACQGGGSHSAFTAGVLKRLLAEKLERYEIVALSGTSGGAICAFLVWYALLKGDRREAVRLLDSFWDSVSAAAPKERVLNDLSVAATRRQGTVATPLVTPYLYPEWGKARLKQMLEELVAFEKIEELVTASSLKLLVGAVEVNTGEFEVFREAEITTEKILASCALPTLFRAVRIGDDGVYWDGLFSQNPPIRDFMREFPDANTKPDEIWLIQINPQRRDHEPTAMADILNRRGELAGNLSLHQEIDFLYEINGLLSYLPKDRYKYIKVRKIEMLRELDAASKMDRRPTFIREMFAYGEEQAEGFLEGVS